MHLTKKLKAYKQLIERVEAFQDPVCDFCADDNNWVGVDPKDRQELCGPDGYNCPGFGGEDEGGNG